MFASPLARRPYFIRSLGTPHYGRRARGQRARQRGTRAGAYPRDVGSYRPYAFTQTGSVKGAPVPPTDGMDAGL